MSLFSTCGVPDRHKYFRPIDSKNDEWTKVYERIRALLSGGAIIALLGNRGSGKTQMGVCLAGHATTNLGKCANYAKAMDIFLRIREGLHAAGDSERAAIREFVEPWLLVIDAFEVRGDTDFENRIIDHIIDKRYDYCRPTIIISNHTETEFRKQVGQSICDRLRETGGICELKISSFRVKP